MIIKIRGIETPVEFRQELISVLEIENKTLFKNLILDLVKNVQSISTPVNLIKDSNVISIDNYEIITDVFNLNENYINSKIIKFLNSEFDKSEYNKIIFNNIEQLKQNFLLYLDDFPLELCYNDNITFLDLLKDFSPKINYETSNNYVNLLNNYLKAIKTLKLADLIIFVDIKRFLTNKEIMQFYENAFILDLSILLIESRPSDLIQGHEWKLNIDEDLYESVLTPYKMKNLSKDTKIT